MRVKGGNRDETREGKRVKREEKEGSAPSLSLPSIEISAPFFPLLSFQKERRKGREGRLMGGKEEHDPILTNESSFDRDTNCEEIVYYYTVSPLWLLSEEKETTVSEREISLSPFFLASF